MAITVNYNGVSIGNVGQTLPAFAYSPNVITITRVTSVTEASVTVSDLVDTSKTVTLTQQFYSNTLNIDISRILRAFSNEVDVSVRDSDNTLSFSLYVINGALPMLEDFGGTYAVRQWQSYPFTIDFLAQGDATLYAKHNGVTGSIGIVSPPSSSQTGIYLHHYDVDVFITADKEIYTSAKGFTTGVYGNKTWSYNITAGCEVPDKESIYLRWVDTRGLTWYWMAQVNEATIKTSSSLTIGRMVMRTTDINEWPEEAQKITSRSLLVGMYNLTDDEYKVVSTLFSSVLIDAYDEPSGRWYRVRIGDGELTEIKKGHLRDIELTIELPPIQTQLP